MGTGKVRWKMDDGRWEMADVRCSLTINDCEANDN